MSTLRDVTRLRPVDAARAFALRAGLAVAVPLIVLTAAGHPDLAGIATFGAFAALYARDVPYRARGTVVALAGLGLVACVALGTLVATGPAPAVTGVLTVSVVGAVATWLCAVHRAGPPGGLMFAFAAGVTAAVPGGTGDIARNAATAAVAWLIVMSGALLDRDAPRRLAVARALRSTAAAREAPEGEAGLRLRNQAVLAVARAWDAMPATRPPGRRRDPVTQLARLVAHAESALADTSDDPGGPGRPERAGLLELADQVTRRGALPRLRGAAAEAAARRVAVTLAYRDLLHRAGRVPAGRPTLVAASRVAVGALAAGGLAGLLAHGTGLGHPYWAAVSAVAVLQGTNLLRSLHRAVQRAGGTVLGLLVAAAVVAVPGGSWTLVAGVVLAQIAAELLVIRNYGLAMVAVTPLALLVGELGHRTARDRQLAAGADPTPAARLLAVRLTALREAYDVAAGEPGLPASATGQVLGAERRARVALTAAAGRLSPAGPWTARP